MLLHRRQPLKVFRKSGGSYVKSEWVDGPETEIDITATIQPLSNGEEMQVIPEGRRSNETYKLYTSSELFTVTDDNPDEVEVYGKRFEVYGKAIWQNGLQNHDKYIVTKKIGK